MVTCQCCMCTASVWRPFEVLGCTAHTVCAMCLYVVCTNIWYAPTAINMCNCILLVFGVLIGYPSIVCFATMQFAEPLLPSLNQVLMTTVFSKQPLGTHMFLELTEHHVASRYVSSADLYWFKLVMLLPCLVVCWLNESSQAHLWCVSKVMTFGQVRGVWVGPERSGTTLWCLIYSVWTSAVPTVTPKLHPVRQDLWHTHLALPGTCNYCYYAVVVLHITKMSWLVFEPVKWLISVSGKTGCMSPKAVPANLFHFTQLSQINRTCNLPLQRRW